MPRHPDAIIIPNTMITKARQGLPSPRRPRQCMSRHELADAVNDALDRLYPDEDLNSQYVDFRWVGKLERGEHRWPSEHRRAALRHVFAVSTDNALDLYSPRRTISLYFPHASAAGSWRTGDLASGEPSGGQVAVDAVLTAAIGDAVLSEADASIVRLPVVVGQRWPSSLADVDAGPALEGDVPGEGRQSASVRDGWRGRRPASYVPFRPAALDGPASDWLRGECSPPVTVSGMFSPVSDEQVDEAAAQLEDLRDLDHRLGAGVAGPGIAKLLGGAIRRLIAGQCDDMEVRGRALQVAVGARELAGYQAVDSGGDGVAQRHYLHALSLSAAAGDRAFGAYLLGVSLGHLALHCGHPEKGLRMGQIALGGVPRDASPAVHASLWAVIARAYARLGDEPACTVALRSAEDHLGRSEPATAPPWIRYLTPAYLADEVGHCMFDLDHHDTAQREVREAVKGVGAGRLRRLAIDSALLASSLAAERRLDEACACGREAVDYAARTQSVRAVQRVAQLRADLIPVEDVPVVSQLVEYIHTVLPAAAI
jgi:hypothetical protein